MGELNVVIQFVDAAATSLLLFEKEQGWMCLEEWRSVWTQREKEQQNMYATRKSYSSNCKDF
jgi:hypothetical protein